MALPRRLDMSETAFSSQSGELLPIFVGGGGDNLLCGECNFMLAQFVELENLRGRKLICPRCERENVIPTVGELTALGQESDALPDGFAHPNTRAGVADSDLTPDSGRTDTRQDSTVYP